jgi:hypothetical protein
VRAVYKVPLVSNLEIDPFSFTCQVEVILVLGLGVLEFAGFYLTDACAECSDNITLHIIGYRQKLSASHIYDLLADHKMYNEAVVIILMV